MVVELKAHRFRPASLGQLNVYVAAVDGELRLLHHAPTAGILVCGSKDDQTVRYALDASAAPVAVAAYTYDALPAEEQASLPSPAAIAAALEARHRSRRGRRLGSPPAIAQTLSAQLPEAHRDGAAHRRA